MNSELIDQSEFPGLVKYPDSAARHKFSEQTPLNNLSRVSLVWLLITTTLLRLSWSRAKI